jgi:CHAT domain-containing protein
MGDVNRRQIRASIRELSIGSRGLLVSRIFNAKRAPFPMRGVIRSLAAILVVGLSAACQTTTPTMSLDEAKQVTAIFSEAFVPPPRTIHDIKALLEPIGGARLPPGPMPGLPAPESVTERDQRVKLGDQYHHRGLMMRRLGRLAEALEALRQASKLITPEMRVQNRRTSRMSNWGFRMIRDLAETEAMSGDYWRARATFETALSAALNVGSHGNALEIRARLVELYALTGDLQTADRTLTALVSTYYESSRWTWPDPAQRAQIEANVARAKADVLELRGLYTEAERLRRAEISAWNPFRSDDSFHRSRRDGAFARLALCLLKQGRLLEAESEARSALRLAVNHIGRTGYETLAILGILTRILREQGRYTEARAIAQATVDLFAQGGASTRSSPSVIAPRFELAGLLAAEGQWTAALDMYTLARKELDDDPLYAQLTKRDPTLAVVLLRTGRLGDAQTALSSALEHSQRIRGEKHSSTAELRGLGAVALAKHGDALAAREEFSKAAAVLLQSGDHFNDDEVTGHSERTQRRNWILAEYIDLLSRARGGGARSSESIAEAFRIAEAARGGVVERALGAAIARSAATAPALADLARREQDAAKQIAALQGLLATTGTEAEADLRRRIEALQGARQTLVQDLTQKFPAYSELINPRPATIDRAQAALRSGEALLATYVGEEQTYVWAVPKTGPVAFSVVPLGTAAIAASVAALRKAPDSGVRRLQDLPAFDVGAAHELYRQILEPVKAGWESADSLIVVAHGPLTRIPWSLLPIRATSLGPERAPLFSNYRAVPWLVRTHAVTVVPSVATLVALRTLAPGDPQRRPFVGFGDPYFNATHAQQGAAERLAALSGLATIGVRDVVMSPGAEVQESRLAMLPRLPDTAEEILAMARTLGADEKRDVFLGVAANEQTVKTLDLSRYRVIAFATHGLVAGDIDGLTQPALALTAPQIANVPGDGLLTMEEILALRFNADWVVLSACNTANGAGAGAEAISGLGRAFFYAGARALLVTHWPVETTSAKAITTEIFLRQAADTALTRARALQQTIKAIIDEGGLIDPATGQMLFSYAHPIFWAPFVLVGDGG